MIKRPGTWITIIFILLALVIMYLYINEKNRKLFPEEIIYNTSEQFRPDLGLFLNNVESTVDKLKSDVMLVHVDELPVESLNRYFSELTSKKDLLYGVVLFGDDMNYVIIRDQDSWVYTYNSLTDSLINWQRIDQNLEPIPYGNWTDTYNNFMDESNFGSAKIMAQLTEGEYMWGAAKSTLPDRHDLLFNVFRLKTDDDVDIAALIYKTSEISNRFSRILLFENPLVSVITKDENIVSPIRTKDTAMITAFRILEEDIKDNYSAWKEIFSEDPHTFQFNQFNQLYYSRFDTITPQLGVKGYVLTISKEDLDNSKQKLEEAFLYAVILLLLFALFAFLTTYNKYKKTKHPVGDSLKPFANDEILSIISQGETEHIEFKSSLRWDYREEKVNKVLEDVIMKSIAAFANAKGGTLFIGVNDDLEIIGLEPDFKTLKKQDADYFELHLRKMINNQYGIKFSNKHLLMQLPVINSQTICVIQILSGSSALFMKTKNKQGQMMEKFYVRSGNSSQEITSLTEVNEYINERFD